MNAPVNRSANQISAKRFDSLRASSIIAVLIVLIACASPASYAQSYRGSIRGIVRDSSGAAIVGATVTVKNGETGLARETTTAEDGGYVVSELPAGLYQVEAVSAGFGKFANKSVSVAVGLETPLDITLSVGSHGETVTVTSVTPIMEASQDVLGGSVDQELVAELPLNGRDFGKLVALVPGVTVEGSGVAGTEKGFGQFNINGNRDRSNNYMLDGTDNNDPWFNNSALNQVGITGAPATLLPVDAIQEFNLQSQFPAEYGRNSGGAVNIITKSGTNQFHGSAFEYFRNSALDARNFFNPDGDPKTLFINNQFGGSIGGPIVHDKTFFFGAYEGQRERVGSNFNLSVPTQAEIADAEGIALGIKSSIQVAPLAALLKFFPASDTNTFPGVVNDFNNLDNFILKLDHRFNSVNSLAVRYAFGQNRQQFPFGSLGGFGSGSRLAPFAQISPTRVQVVSASLLSALDATHTNELRFGYTRFRNSFTSADAGFDPNSVGLNFGTGFTGLPEIDFGAEIENLGATAFSVPRARVSQNYQILDNFTWVRGKHTLKFGAEFRRAWVSAFNDNLERGLITFSPSGLSEDPVTDVLANYFLGNAFAEGNAGNTQRTTYNNGVSLFAQDELRLRPNLTVTYGLRWEYFGPISEKNNLLSNFPGPFSSTSTLELVGHGGLSGAYNRDLNNFGPRLSVAWSPFENTVVRAGYGIFYDYIPQDLMIANFTDVAGIATNPIGPQPVLGLDFNQDAFNGSAVAPGQPPAPVFTPTTSDQPEIFVTQHNLRTPYVGEWNLNIQQQISRGAVVQIGYVGSKGTRLTRLFDANQDFINDNYSTVDTFATNTSSTYNALQLQARFANWHRFSGFASYVFSKSLDGASDGIDFNFATAAFPQDSDNLKAEKGPSTFDAKHRFTAALNYQVPVWSALPRKLAEGWQWNTIVTAMSGQPIGIITSDGGINFHQRPNVVPGQPRILPGRPGLEYINPLAFSQPDDATAPFGDLGRDAVYGPGFWNIDFSLTKDTKITERLNLQLRAEFFNIFNHPQFALPSGVITPGAPIGDSVDCGGCFITQTPDVAQGNPGLGGGGPRVVQLAVRFQF
jgi:carboxypeptidase family protein/TonB-dependent receptor-like protein